MYLKNLDCRICVRLKYEEMNFVKMLSVKSGLSFSQTIRGIIENYRLRYFDVEHEND